MFDSHQRDIADLEKSIRDLNALLGRVGQSRELEELIRIIHRPGWTTPAELRFAQALVSITSNHATALAAAKTELLQASRQVAAPGAAVGHE